MSGLHDYLAQLGRASVLVVGDVMLDSYWHGRTDRISPEAPVPVVKVEEDEHRVGGAGNVALNVATLGSRAMLLALAGDDEPASKLKSLLIEKGVDCFMQTVLGSKTITKLRVLSRHQQLIRLDFEDRFSQSVPDSLLPAYRTRIERCGAVILSDYAKGTLRDAASLIAIARGLGKPVVVDPKGTDFERYRGATVITPNMSEFEAVVGKCGSDTEIARKGIVLRDALELEALLITRSEKGMTLLARGADPQHLATEAREVYDVTGAGDTVVATLAVGLAAGIPVTHAVCLSNIAAAIVVGKLGTATVAQHELGDAINRLASVQKAATGTLDVRQEVVPEFAT
jgi:D-beta-D-heptose 7-phosphate kinase/D-beta-D-heptose 1-phosphate adenosyltransferase